MVYKDVSLRNFNTFGLDYKADCLAVVNSVKEAGMFLSTAEPCKGSLKIIGDGSNILLLSDFRGTILKADIGGIETEDESHGNIIVSAGAGVEWDNLVEWCVENGLGGLENLSFIPGTVGASAVQNIGAYGSEASDSIAAVMALSIDDGTPVTFSNSECRFGYRTSIFKHEARGKYLVTGVSFRLGRNIEPVLSYGNLRDEVLKLGDINVRNIRNAVIAIRKSKLPDPAVLGNAGSFFKNPVVSRDFAENLKKASPDIPMYRTGDETVKLAAGWLIESCGWKGKRLGDAGVHDKQALVLVNYGNASGKQILDLSDRIRESVLNTYGVELEPEVETVGSI